MKNEERVQLANATGRMVRESSTRTSSDGEYHLVGGDGVVLAIYRDRATYEAALRMRMSSRAQRAARR